MVLSLLEEALSHYEIVLTISITLSIFAIDRLRVWRETRIDNFRTNFKSLFASRFAYSEEMRGRYIKKYNLSNDDYLIKEEEWEKDLKRTNSIKIRTSNPVKTPKILHYFSRIIWMPSLHKDYSYNVWRYIGRSMFNSDTAAISNIDFKEGSNEITIRKSTYLRYYNSCERLAYTAVRIINHAKYMRDWRINRLLIDCMNYRNRDVGIGVCSLTFFYNL